MLAKWLKGVTLAVAEANPNDEHSALFGLETSRVELFVFCVALSYGVKICGPVSIWSNCLSVARRANFCLIGYGPIHINSSNSDLWQRLMDLLSQFEPGRLIINKIRAHWEYFLATTSFDA